MDPVLIGSIGVGISRIIFVFINAAEKHVHAAGQPLNVLSWDSAAPITAQFASRSSISKFIRFRQDVREYFRRLRSVQ